MSIATKYQVDAVCAAVVKALKQQWPTTLTNFLRVRKEFHARTTGLHFGALPSAPEPAGAIRLAVDFNVPETLPAAYYALSIHDIAYPRAIPGHSPRFDLLRHEELLRYYQGKHLLARRFVNLVDVYTTANFIMCDLRVEEFDEEAGEPYKTLPCQRALARAKEARSTNSRSLSDAFNKTSRADPFCTLVDIYEGRDDNSEICSPCRDGLQSRCRDKIQALWESLPRLFSLEVRFHRQMASVRSFRRPGPPHPHSEPSTDVALVSAKRPTPVRIRSPGMQ